MEIMETEARPDPMCGIRQCWGNGNSLPSVHSPHGIQYPGLHDSYIYCCEVFKQHLVLVSTVNVSACLKNHRVHGVPAGGSAIVRVGAPHPPRASPTESAAVSTLGRSTGSWVPRLHARGTTSATEQTLQRSFVDPGVPLSPRWNLPRGGQ